MNLEKEQQTLAGAILSSLFFAVAYFAAAELGHALSFAGNFASFWPPSGLYVAVLLSSSPRRWPVLILAAYAGNLTSDILLHDKTFAVSFAFSTGNTLEATIGAFALRRYAGRDFTLHRVNDVLALAVFSALFGTALGAAVGSTTVMWAYGGSFGSIWLTWWFSSIVGVLVVAPLVLRLIVESPGLAHTMPLTRAIELVVMLVGLTITVEYVFGHQTYPFAWLVVPFLLWSALRFELTGVVLAVSVVAFLTVLNTAHDRGPFATLSPFLAKVMITQSFVCMLALTFLVVAAVVRERRELVKSIEQSENRWRELFDHMEEFVFSTDLEGRFVQVNRAAREALGYEKQELQLMTIDQIFVTEERDSCRQMLDEILTGELVRIFHSLLLTRSGSTLEVEGTAETHFEEDVPTYHLLIYRDVTDRNRQYRELKEHRRKLEDSNLRLEVLATTDGLTGLNNRRVFQERLHDEVVRANRYSLSFSLLMLDVDHFKSFNDTFGHPAGDRALKIVARLLQSTARSTDFVSRYGGEEFAILLPSTDHSGALVLAERFREAVQNAEWDDRPITISVGVATLEEGEQSAEHLLERADAALYRSKQGGRNCVRS